LSKVGPLSLSILIFANKGKNDIINFRIKSLWQIRKQEEQDIKLWVYPDNQGQAVGYLYQDDGFTFDYQKGIYNLYKFYYSIKNGKPNMEIISKHSNYEGQKINWTVKVAGSDEEVEIEFTQESN
jgi:alpha-glucosidase (family GH31 glycosyl hydrolase)